MTRFYLIIQASELDAVDFSQVCDTSPETVRLSGDGTKTFIKWEGEQPAFVSGLTETEGPYTNAEMRTILATDVWSSPEEG